MAPLTSFLNQLFGRKETGSSMPDEALQQGVTYNHLQNRIMSRVYPNLPLIEQTSGAGLGSLVETLENMSDAKTPLEKTDAAEWKRLSALEDKFNKTLSDYTQAYKQYTESLINSSGPVELNSPLYAKVRKLNDELLTLSKNMWGQVQNIHVQDQQLESTVQKHRAVLQTRLQSLSGERDRLNQLARQQETLTGELANSHLVVDSAYYRYIVWFGAAVTLGLVAMHRAAQ